MRNISSELQWINTWITPFALLALSWLASKIVRKWIERAAHNKQLLLLAALAPSLSSLVLVIGLHLFIDLAPLSDKATIWLQNIVYVYGVWLVTQMVRAAALQTLDWGASQKNSAIVLQRGFLPMIRNLLSIFIYSVGAIMILQHFKYDVMSLIAALGVGSLAIGLAAKETLANMISGFTLILDRNLKHGDRINLSGQVGDVEEIGIRSTRIHLDSGSTLIVPNSELVNTKIVNLSQPTPAIACHVRWIMTLDSSFSEMQKLAEEVGSQLQLREPTKPMSTQLLEITPRGQLIQMSFWVKDFKDQGQAITEFQRAAIQKMQGRNLKFSVQPAISIN